MSHAQRWDASLQDLAPMLRKGLNELRKLVWAKIRLAEGGTLSGEEKAYAKKVGISIMAGMGVGKDFFASVAILWMLCCFPRPIIPCTAPTAHQLRDVLWREIQKVRLGDQWIGFLKDLFYGRSYSAGPAEVSNFF